MSSKTKDEHKNESEDWRAAVASAIPQTLQNAVLVKSVEMPKGAPYVHGYDFDQGPVDYDALLKSYTTQGFQGTNLGKAIEQVNAMLKCTVWKYKYLSLSLSLFHKNLPTSSDAQGD